MTLWSLSWQLLLLVVGLLAAGLLVFVNIAALVGREWCRRRVDRQP